MSNSDRRPVSVVTGANSGIGRATSIHLAKQGHRVAGTVRSIVKAEKLQAMAADAGVEVELFELDVADDDSVRDGFAEILAATGRVDHLVNNAGVGGNAVAEECPPQSYLDVMNVNLCGAVRCLQAVLPQMRERGSGTVVNISSVAGRIAAIAQSPYVASKWAFEGLSEGLAQELAPFEVAEVIHTAITTDEHRLRWPVSWGGAELAELHDRIDDSDWIALGAIEEDAAYYERFHDVFGLDLR
jgi:NAD(P)-dependent dehydrogenase (short-subunit alcohol dehydrogenase family)